MLPLVLLQEILQRDLEAWLADSVNFRAVTAHREALHGKTVLQTYGHVPQWGKPVPKEEEGLTSSSSESDMSSSESNKPIKFIRV
jgi:hypothetical protein